MSNYQENLSQEDKKLRELIKLSEVEVPSDFNFKVKNRIAKRRETEKNSGIWRIPLVLVPTASLAVIALAFWFFNPANQSNYSSDLAQNNVSESLPKPEASPQKVETVETKNNQEENLLPQKTSITPQSEKSKTSENLKIESKTNVLTETKTEKTSGKTTTRNEKTVKQPTERESKSRILAGTEEKTIITPRGLPNRGIPAPILNENEPALTAESVLQELGIETADENGVLKVKSVRKNSIAERSGVQKDDLIKAIDEQPLTPQKEKMKSIKGSNLNVERNGKSLNLKLKN